MPSGRCSDVSINSVFSDVCISQLVFNAIVKRSSTPIQVVDKDGLTLDVNQEFINAFGATTSEDFSIFKYLSKKSPVFKDLIDKLKSKEMVHFDQFYYDNREFNFDSMNLLPLVKMDAFPLENDNYVLIYEVLNKSFVLGLEDDMYKYLVESSPDVMWIFNYTKNKFTYISNAVTKLRGFTPEEIIDEKIEDTMTRESYLAISNILESSVKDFYEGKLKDTNHILSIEQKTKDGKLVWTEISARLNKNEDDEIEIIGVSRNITGRKKIENEMLYVSYHDTLTGLYNRRFYEEELRRLDTPENLPITLILGDVNGLKLINDSFGHKKGDELLQKAANAITKGCKDDGIIARLGGDEFIIILTKSDFFDAEQIIRRIKKTTTKENDIFFDLSISFGYDTKSNENTNLEETFKNAEDIMYKNKLYESSSMRTKTIDMIMNTLYEKSHREMLHSKRVSDLCKAIATYMNFDQDEINNVKLAGLMHDIGKMGINEEILNKPNKLTVKQWEEMKKHPEIGYRILNSSNEFSEMAKYVLEHHEKYDGTGYPNKLKGEEISLEARIIAVADAYDAMTCDRKYRKGLSEEEAIKEIKACSGTQFDPKVAQILVEKILDKQW